MLLFNFVGDIMVINIGNMREKIIIQKRSVSYVKGVKVENWNEDNPYYSCSAELLDLYGQEKYSAYQVKLENSVKFKTRMCNLLKELIGNAKDYRVIWNSEPYDLIFVDSCNGSRNQIILQVQKVS